jgi:hypothetical protein
MRIIDLNPVNEAIIQQTARVLFQGFGDTGSAGWLDLDAALSEVRQSLESGRISRVAVENGAVVGWVGAIRGYDGHAW